MSDWISTIKQSVGGNTHAEINAPDAGMLLTDTELVYLNANGIQRARLGEIAKVGRENGELVISSSDRPLIRGAIKSDKETLSNFFSQVRQVAAWSRERRTVIMDSPSATPMDPSFVGRTPEAAARVDLPDPIAEMPVPQPVRPVVTVLPSETANPFAVPPPLPTTQSLGRGVSLPPPMPRSADADLIAQDRPRVTAAPLPRFSSVQVESGKLEFAGFWVRFFAYVIDFILLAVVTGILNAVFSGGNREVATNALGLGSIASLIFVWLYYAVLESGERQATLGKMALGLIVTDENNQRLSFGRSTARFAARAILTIVVTGGAGLLLGVAALGSVLSMSSSDPTAFLPLLLGALFALLLLLASYLMAAFTTKKQALHDLIAKTVVLRK